MKKITLIIPVLLTLLLSCDVASKVEEDRWPDDATVFGITVNTTTIAGNLTFTPSITGISALAGGEVTSEGSSPVTDRGVCWSTNPDPTIFDSRVSDLNPNGASTYTQCFISGLVPETQYYVRAYATNASGTAYGANTSFNSGRVFGGVSADVGGYVFYNNGNGGGLVAAVADIAAQAWSPIAASVDIVGITEPGLGKGRTNTITIVSFHAIYHSSPAHAALACDTYASYLLSDWFLPSRLELYLMYKNLYLVNSSSFTGTIYWTSCQGSISTDNAEALDFQNNIPMELLKTLNGSIRPVREFF